MSGFDSVQIDQIRDGGFVVWDGPASPSVGYCRQILFASTNLAEAFNYVRKQFVISAERKPRAAR
jgi:hypothetical protein